MPLDWDVLLDNTSIKDTITGFTIRQSKGSYARELTLSSADPDFYGRFVYTRLPEPRVEVRTKTESNWISLGHFFIEKPIVTVLPDKSTSPGVWGRSKTALAGPPFAQKISRYYDHDTSFHAIMKEMAQLCGLEISFEIDDYPVAANTYVIDNTYPANVITQLADFAGAYVVSTSSDSLLIRKDIFHPASHDVTITDNDIISMNESVDLPEFGNRIRISPSGGMGAGYSVSLVFPGNSDCLSADGISKGTVLAFVKDSQNNPAQDNTVVQWRTKGTGITLDCDRSATGDYLLSSQIHKASDYYTVSVNYPVKEVIGIWAYADSGGRDNFWNSEGFFSDRTIKVKKPFAYCDQTLRITYITSGCAVNTITAGKSAGDVEITADVNGAEDTGKIKLDNTCVCGSDLNVAVNPVGSICLGNKANILIWATINQKPATGHRIKARITSGCGQLSSQNKILKSVSVLNEVSYAQNVVNGITQAVTRISIADDKIPAVWLFTDTAKSQNLYLSHQGNIIDLDRHLATGTKLVIDYHAQGAALIAWRTLGEIRDCEAQVTVSMANGTEAGLHEKLELNAVDCTQPLDPVDHNEDISDADPVSDDQSGGNDGGFKDTNHDQDMPEQSGNYSDPCLAVIMNRTLNIDDAVSQDDRDALRFGVQSDQDCPDTGPDAMPCKCSDLCESEVNMYGNTLDYEQTIHEIVSKDYDKGTPGYNEAFNSLKEQNIQECSQKCADKRTQICGDCKSAAGPDVLAPGESAEYVCADGTTTLFTMPDDACGTVTVTVGCCSKEVRSTAGRWVLVDHWATGCGTGYGQVYGTVIEGGHKTNYTNSCQNPPDDPYWETTTFECTDFTPPIGDYPSIDDCSEYNYTNCGFDYEQGKIVCITHTYAPMLEEKWEFEWRCD